MKAALAALVVAAFVFFLAIEGVGQPVPPRPPRSLRLSGIRAFDRQWDVRVEHGRVSVDEA